MCKTAYYIHPVCKCRWTCITQPCAPGLGFSTCPLFFNGQAKPMPPTYQVPVAAQAAPLPFAPHLACPKHDLCGSYDRNVMRRVVKVRKGIRWGVGPNKDDCGVECPCSVM